MAKDKKIVVRCRAIITHQNKLLLVVHPHNMSQTVLPGGHLEWGEDVRTCLEREINEELGIRPKIGRLLYINTFYNTNNIYSVEFFFEVTNGSEYFGENLKLHNLEISKVIWADKNMDISILPSKLGDFFRSGELFSNETRFLRN